MGRQGVIRIYHYLLDILGELVFYQLGVGPDGPVDLLDNFYPRLQLLDQLRVGHMGPFLYHVGAPLREIHVEGVIHITHSLMINILHHIQQLDDVGASIQGL